MVAQQPLAAVCYALATALAADGPENAKGPQPCAAALAERAARDFAGLRRMRSGVATGQNDAYPTSPSAVSPGRALPVKGTPFHPLRNPCCGPSLRCERAGERLPSLR